VSRVKTIKTVYLVTFDSVNGDAEYVSVMIKGGPFLHRFEARAAIRRMFDTRKAGLAPRKNYHVAKFQRVS
jgi:hypothetical protein